MPQKNTIRTYILGGYYHVYNRGVEKRNIFKNDNDYNTFLSTIESYLTPKKPLGSEERIKDSTYWRSKLDKDEIEILCHCLMPNHFHLLIKQNSDDGITKFMRRISNAYVSYFNKRYDRVGSLFQGKFKAALVNSDEYLLHLSRYIHINVLEVRPLNLEKTAWLREYPYSSYPDYLGKRKTPWVKPQTILSYFKREQNTFPIYQELNTYQSFVENYKGDSKQELGELALD